MRIGEEVRVSTPVKIASEQLKQSNLLLKANIPSRIASIKGDYKGIIESSLSRPSR